MSLYLYKTVPVEDSSKTKKEILQVGSETWYNVWFSDGGLDKKTGGVKIFIWSDQDGHD